MSQEDGRYLSIIFDDGIATSAEQAVDILANYGFSASFYVVTGWVRPKKIPIKDKYNRLLDHGDWDFWRRVVAAGHEVGSHSFSHLNVSGKLATFFPIVTIADLLWSAHDIKTNIPQPLITISMPFNESSAVSTQVVKRTFAGRSLGTSDLKYNPTIDLDVYNIVSWAPSRALLLEQYRKAIAEIPIGSWLILQLHGFEREGWEPISTAEFVAILDAAKTEGLAVRSVCAMIEALRCEN